MLKRSRHRCLISTLLLLVSPVQARVVSQLAIQKIGLYDAGPHDEKRACETFHPTKKQLVRYFALAEERQARKIKNRLMRDDYSPCLASGMIECEDGTTAAWTLQSFSAADFCGWFGFDVFPPK